MSGSEVGVAQELNTGVPEDFDVGEFPTFVRFGAHGLFMWSDQTSVRLCTFMELFKGDERVICTELVETRDSLVKS